MKNNRLIERKHQLMLVGILSLAILFSPMIMPTKLSLSRPLPTADASVVMLGSGQQFYDSMGLGRPDHWVKAGKNTISVRRIFVPNGPICYRETQTLQHGMVVQILTERLSRVGAWKTVEWRFSNNGDFFEAVRYDKVLTGSL